MKKWTLIGIVCAVAATSRAQGLKFKVEGLKDTTIFLANYLGDKLYYADTSYSEGGVIRFDRKKHPRGFYAVILPGGRNFRFFIDREDVDMVIGDEDDMVGATKVNQSVSNQVFYDYLRFMNEKNKAARKLSEEYKKAAGDSTKQEKISKRLQSIGEGVKEAQKKLAEEHKDRLVGPFVLMATELDLPEPPRDENGIITDSSYVYRYYIQHYWDGVPLDDPAIVNTPVYHQKLDRYFSPRGIAQIPDTINKYARLLLDQMDQVDQESRLFRYTLQHITNKYELSKIMGMDAVFVYMADNYYCGENNKAWWMKEEQTKKICERARKLRNITIGKLAPPLILPDTTEKNWINSHTLDVDYTVLYFWDPNCGHCKKSTPKLQRLYEEKWKGRSVGVYAIGKAAGDDFEDWKKFIREKKLTFINVGLTKNVYNQALEDPLPLLKKTTLKSLNYSDTYDVYSNPRIFILGKDKKIKYKQLSIAQLEEIIDHLTGHDDDPKLYPIEEEEEEEKKDDGKKDE